MFDFADETLKQMPFPIAPLVIFRPLYGILLRWDHGDCAASTESIQKILRTIATVSDDEIKVQVGNQIVRFDEVVTLPSSQMQAQPRAQASPRHMDFGAEATATASQRLFSLTAVFLWLRRRWREHGQGCCPPDRSPYRDHRQSIQASAPTPPYRTSGQNAGRHYSTVRTRRAASATEHRCNSSISPLRQNDGIPPRFPPTPSGRLARMPEFSSIVPRLGSHRSSTNLNRLPSIVNRTSRRV